MKSVTLPVVVLLALGVAVRVSSAPKPPANDFNSQHTKWIKKSLQEMQTIKVGMTRAQLSKVFTTEGGLSTRTQRRYVYRQCPYIKVDVEFRAVGTSKQYYESSHDVITKISKPFLEWRILD